MHAHDRRQTNVWFGSACREDAAARRRPHCIVPIRPAAPRRRERVCCMPPPGVHGREEAARAVALEPSSAIAHYTQGWILEHDKLGRRFGRGFDLAGAEAALREAKRLDPNDAV